MSAPYRPETVVTATAGAGRFSCWDRWPKAFKMPLMTTYPPPIPIAKDDAMVKRTVDEARTVLIVFYFS